MRWIFKVCSGCGQVHYLQPRRVECFRCHAALVDPECKEVEPMLALSRKKGERIVIDHHTTIEILAIGCGKVRLGIVAPKDVQIHREEVYRDIHGLPNPAKPKKPAPFDVAHLVEAPVKEAG